MAYQIFCDGYPLYDLLDDDLILLKPRCKLESNAAGEASFTILSNHPYYHHLKRMSSSFEIKQDGETIFRGRMTGDGGDFDNKKTVELEGALTYLNDSIVRPFDFPKDFLDDPEYQAAAASGNTVRFLLGWLIDQHNAQVSPFQQFKLGNVTVSDGNNYVYKYDKAYSKTLDILRTRFFGSALGGFLCVRYEADGNYIDYLAGFDANNQQRIVYGENMLDLNRDTDAGDAISAIIPLGGEIAKKSGNDYNGSYVTIEGVDTEQLTLKDLPDGDITDDIAKIGDVLYSKAAVEQYGWIYANPSETTWDDVTKPENLRSRGVDYLEKSVGFMSTITIQAFDLHLTNKEVEAFRINRNVIVESDPHGVNAAYPLSELDIDIENPQNTKITVGSKKRALTDYTSDIARSVEWIKHEYVPVDNISGLTDQIGNGIDGIGNDVDGLKSDVKGLKSDVGGLGDRVGKAESDISKVQGDVGSKAEQSDVDDLSERMSNAETAIENLENEYGTGEVSRSEFDELESRMDAAESSLESKAEQSDVDALEGRVDSLETRMDAVEASVEDHEYRLDKCVTTDEFNQRLDEVRRKINDIDDEFDAVRARLDKIEGFLGEMHGPTFWDFIP